MTQLKVLVADKDIHTSSEVEAALSRDGVHVLSILPEQLSAAMAREIGPAIILIGLSFPETEELDLLKGLHANPETRELPIIVLSNSDDPSVGVTSFDLGASDFITRPFNAELFAARIKSALRKNTQAQQDDKRILTLGRLSINPIRHEVTIDNSRVDLTASEFDLFYFLARQNGKVFTRSQIIERLHGPGYGVATRSVDVHLVGVREKLGAFAKCVQTVRGIGYRFAEENIADIN